MFVIMNIINNTYLVSWKEKREHIFKSGKQFIQPAVSFFKDPGYNTPFGKDVRLFREHLKHLACKKGNGWERAHDLSFASNERLLTILNIQPKKFDTREAAEYFLEQYPPKGIGKEYIVIIEE
jgi:hypothetical protein